MHMVSGGSSSILPTFCVYFEGTVTTLPLIILCALHCCCCFSFSLLSMSKMVTVTVHCSQGCQFPNWKNPHKRNLVNQKMLFINNVLSISHCYWIVLSLNVYVLLTHIMIYHATCLPYYCLVENIKRFFNIYFIIINKLLFFNYWWFIKVIALWLR